MHMCAHYTEGRKTVVWFHLSNSGGNPDQQGRERKLTTDLHPALFICIHAEGGYSILPMKETEKEWLESASDFVLLLFFALGAGGFLLGCVWGAVAAIQRYW